MSAEHQVVVFSLVADDSLSDFERFFTLPVSLKRSIVFNTGTY